MSAGLVFAYERRVAFADTDMAGIAHFTSVLRWVEEAEAAWWRAQNRALCRHEPDGTIVGWPKVAVNVEYLAPAHFDELLVVTLAVERDGRTSRTWRFTVNRNADGVETAKGTLTVVRVARSPDGVVTRLPVG
jgi:acyl-CoA thioester hydrolase